MVRFKFSSSSLEMSAESTGVGRADVVMDVDVKGAGGSIGFNPDYVLEALKVAEGNRTRASQLLGISDRTLRNKLNN